MARPHSTWKTVAAAAAATTALPAMDDAVVAVAE